MNEKNMQTLFGEYLRKNPPQESEVYELKFTSGNVIPFDAVKEHQVAGLLAAEGKGLYHRITDQPWMTNRPYSYTLKKPFDCFFLAKVKAFVVIWFYKARQGKWFIKIRIEDFLKYKKRAARKSLTEDMALAIAEKIVNINQK